MFLPGIDISVGSFSDSEGFEVFLVSDFTCDKETSIDFGFDRLLSSDFAFINRLVSKFDDELSKVSDFCMEAISLYGIGLSPNGSCFDLAFETISLSALSFSGSSPIIGVEEGMSIEEEWETSIPSFDKGAETRAIPITGIVLEEELDTIAKSEKKLPLN